MIEFSCPNCAKILKTADDKAGLEARCPGCGQPVVVPTTAAGAQSAWEEPPPVDSDSAPMKTCPMCGAQVKAAANICRYCGENFHQPSSAPRAGRNLLTPHRGGLILALGILTWMVCPIFGFFAWIMGSADLREMDAGRMDPEGRGLTQAGQMLGIIYSILILVVVVVVVIGACIVGIVAIADM